MQEKVLLEKMSLNEKDTKTFAAQIVNYIRPGDTVLLYGNLGSGKTFITREFVKLLGNRSSVSSPSFTIVNRYDGDPCVNHIDLYRISDGRELSNLGLDEMLSSDDINFIEWPQLLEKKIDWDHYRLQIEHNSDEEFKRSLKFMSYAEK